MIKAAVSEFKAKLSNYLRLVKAGEQIEVQERGIAVAVLSGLASEEPLLVIPPTKDPLQFGRLKPQVKLDGVDAVKLLLEERQKR